MIAERLNRYGLAALLAGAMLGGPLLGEKLADWKKI